jgi:hypothetical protein
MGTSASENIAIGITTAYDGAGTTAAKKDLGALGDAGKKAQGALADFSKNNVNAQIGGFEALGKKIDVTNAGAVQGYRAQGDALASNLIKLGATDQELNKVGAAIAKVERAAGASMLDPKSPQAAQIQQLPGKIRTAAGAIGILGQAAVTGGGSMAGLAMAVGNVSAGLGSLATSAKAVAAASWLTVLIQLGATAVGMIEGFSKQTRDLNKELGGLQSAGRGLADTLAGDDLRAKLEGINHAADDEIKKIQEVGFVERQTDKLFQEHAKQRIALIDQINANRQKSIALAATQEANEAAARSAERQAQITIGRAGLELEQERASRRKSDLELQNLALVNEQKQRDAEIRQSFVRRSASGEIIALNAQELAQLAALLDQNNKITEAKQTQLLTEKFLQAEQARATRLQESENFGERFRGRLEEIELARAAEIQSLADIEGATINAEQKKRALYRETAHQASADAKTLFEVFRSSSDKSLKAIGTFGDTLRRVAIGAEAARAAVRAAVELGEAIASAAGGDLGGAALHGAAALQLGSAAALGFRESLGGGGGGSGGGGGGGAPTFQPRDTGGGGGNITLIINTVDPTNKELIRTVSWHLQRQQTLKTPVYSVSAAGFLLGAGA